MSVRTPDPYPGWLSEEDLYEARQRLPMVYVEAVPVRCDPLGYVTEVGLLLQATDEGKMVRTFVSGRVMYRETIRAALLRHLEKDLGPMAFPQLPPALTPFAVAEYFPSPSQSGLTDERQHAVALAYLIPVTGECEPRQDALELSWLTPEEALSPEIYAEFAGGRGDLLRQALASASWGR
ncbi:NUDIX hydrolase family protein [Arthrobacter sp. zg-Y820]|uniref:NUDIX hydrolase family protein n=1 Tax=unclassified Arthrobacter TaxID=235627 RepID=UPI001E477494|nr:MULTISPECIES: NUDIX hydrolase family protein [unclassified Arthrobacter]MCC9198311.1 NUDIX hydrolase family protein [Arthrobacter sp. zg-Y820]MDK1281181.1 NUDIX hydrolase family protein [Arthrobacter sp. zg.Y820]MDK1361511.1 NUDIX hydrolase family protein [Arthrobacter sp. zg-Y1219]WIB09772.1 NUDIX hydrolase family protein [Arthrobacter sp. zg-Y820]